MTGDAMDRLSERLFAAIEAGDVGAVSRLCAFAGEDVEGTADCATGGEWAGASAGERQGAVCAPSHAAPTCCHALVCRCRRRCGLIQGDTLFPYLYRVHV